MKKTLKINFKGRPDLACSSDELRPAMNVIYIHKGGLVATNGHILVKFPLAVSGFEEHAEKLEGYTINPEQYREILRYNILQFENPGEIKAYKTVSSGGFWTVFKLKHISEIAERGFPEYEKILAFEGQEIDEIGLNQYVLQRLLSCFQGLPHVGNLRLRFQKKNQGIHLSPEDSELKEQGLYALIMPVMLNPFES